MVADLLADLIGGDTQPDLSAARLALVEEPRPNCLNPHADELHKLRAGEVLVCPTTSAAWMMVFRRAAALVTDAGSVLSHTAIVAREFALPAVAATANATSTLMDGEEVIVDGSRGVVTRC